MGARAGDPMSNHDVWYLNESLSKGSFYVAETNYDRKKAPPSFDDRRYPMENCLEQVRDETRFDVLLKFLHVLVFFSIFCIGGVKRAIFFVALAGWAVKHHRSKHLENFEQQPHSQRTDHLLNDHVCWPRWVFVASVPQKIPLDIARKNY